METVHEEEACQDSETTKINEFKTFINNLDSNNNLKSISIQPTDTEIPKPNFSSSTPNLESKEDQQETHQETQLYEQLTQLKPLKSKSFKSSTSICLNIKEVSPSSEHRLSENIPARSQPSNISTSMIITPNQIPDELSFNPPSQACSSAYVNLASNKNSTGPKLSVRFSDSPPVSINRTILNKSKIITNGSMQSKLGNKSESLSSEGSNSSSSTSISYSSESKSDTISENKISSSNQELNSGNEIGNNKTSCLSTVLVTRRQNSNNSVVATSSSCSAAPRRISLSVTDL